MASSGQKNGLLSSSRNRQSGNSEAATVEKGSPAWCNQCSWYESSNASDMLGIQERNLLQNIHRGMYPHLRMERGDKVDAPEPYNSFKFVFVAPEGSLGEAEMTLKLREWTRLCNALGSGEFLCSDMKELFRKYTGLPADDDVVEKQRALACFTLPEALKKLKTTKTVAMASYLFRATTNLISNNSSGRDSSFDGSSLNELASKASTLKSNSYDTRTLASGCNPHDNATKNICCLPKVCVGLCNARLDNFVEAHGDNGRLYCMNSGWAHFRTLTLSGRNTLLDTGATSVIQQRAISVRRIILDYGILSKFQLQLVVLE